MNRSVNMHAICDKRYDMICTVCRCLSIAACWCHASQLLFSARRRHRFIMASLSPRLNYANYHRSLGQISWISFWPVARKRNTVTTHHSHSHIHIFIVYSSWFIFCFSICGLLIANAFKSKLNQFKINQLPHYKDADASPSPRHTALFYYLLSVIFYSPLRAASHWLAQFFRRCPSAN